MKVHSRRLATRPYLRDKFELLKRFENKAGYSLAFDSIFDPEPGFDLIFLRGIGWRRRESVEGSRQYYILHSKFKKSIVAAAYVCLKGKSIWELCTIGSMVKGGGTAIIDAIVRDMKKLHIKRLQLYALEEACGFYEKYGFTRGRCKYNYYLTLPFKNRWRARKK